MSEKTIRILLIEANLGNARLVRENLTDAMQSDLDIPDFEVVRTVKLSTGLKRLSKGDIDVVLLDLSLPDSQGLDTLTKVHTQAPEVPVVILSDPEDKALAVEAVRKGAQDHLVKGQTSGALLIRSIHYAVKYAQAEANRQRTEETLRASEKRFRLLYENTPLAYHSLDKDGRLIEVNQTWLDMLGYSRDQVIGRWFGNFLTPQHADDFKQSFPRFIATGTTHTEFEMVRQDGSHIVVSIDGRVGRDEQENFRQTHCTLYDVTERVQAEKALQENEERHRLISELTTDYTFRLDIDADGNAMISMVSENFSAATGRSLEEAKTPDLWTSIFHPQDLERAMAFFQTVVSTGQPGEIECRTYVKGGRQRWIQILARSMWDEEEHRTVAILGAVKDITKRRLAEEAVQYRIEFERLITDISTHFINLASDKVDGGISRALKTIGEFTGVDRSYVLLFSDNGMTMDNTHEWCAEGIQPQIQKLKGIPTDIFQWSLERIRRAEVVHVPCVTDLPPEASAEREEFQAEEIQSLIMVPIVYGGTALGVLGLDSVRAEREWEEDIIALLRIVGETFANALERKQAEEALLRARREWEEIFQAIGHPTLILDTQHKITAANRAAANAAGKPAHELEAQTCHNIFHGSSAPPNCCPLETVLTSEQVETAEMEMETLDGTYLVSCTPVLDNEGNLEKFIHIATDITEQKKATEALRESEERYRELANSIADVFFAMDTELRFTYWNTASEQLTGLAAKDALDRSIQEVFPDNENLKEMIQAYKKVIKTQKPHAFVTDYHPVGTGFFEISAYPSRDGISVFAKDITERVHSEQERAQAEEERERLLARIQEQAQRVQQIIETVPEGVILLDTDARIILANPLGRKGLTVLADTLVGGTLTRLGDRPLAEILTSPPEGLWHEIAAEGRDFQVIARPVSKATEASPTPGGWVLVIHDVTQQREGERRIQQQERLAAVGQLAAGIAHDFNNIMAVITLYTGMSLRTPDVPENVYERLEIINQQAQRASDLIQQIMDFSRRAVLERGPLDLLAFMKEQVNLLQRTLPESIKIDLSYGKDEYTIRADLTRIQQVIMNLATNARDAMPQGGKLHITLERIWLEQSDTPPISEMEAGEWVCVRVADTGSGIPDDVLPHIFNPFFTTKEPGQGSGLGLAQVYGIINQHEGHVDVKTQTGKGTTFILYLPALSVSQPKAPIARSEQLSQGQGQTILVVEDETTTRAAVVGSLELFGYQVLEAANGKEALAVFEQHADQADQPDRIALVLSDVVMPEMGGQALFYALKQQDPDVKVLLLTGHPLEEEGLKALLAQGLTGWLPKPPSLEQLAEAVAQVLGEE